MRPILFTIDKGMIGPNAILEAHGLFSPTGDGRWYNGRIQP